MKFILSCVDANNQLQIFKYNNLTSEIFNKDGNLVEYKFRESLKLKNHDSSIFPAISKEHPGSKSIDIHTLKIQLGLSCNYGCEYCSQRFVPHADSINPNLVKAFLLNAKNWLKSPPKRIEFWGGEPLVYWKTLKPLAEGLAEMFADVKMSMVTNGSILTDEIVEWIDAMDFGIGLSHDGPGQNVRGPDPLDDPEQARIIRSLYSKLAPKNDISFNSMVHRENYDRKAIQQYFAKFFGNDDFSIGEGGIIDVYDEGGMANSFDKPEHYAAFRTLTFRQIRAGEITKFNIARSRIHELLVSFVDKRDAMTLGQKCGMDDKHNIAIDLYGNVLTCQNVTSQSEAPNGNSHKIGHVNTFDKIKLDTSTHWSFRKKCMDCPVLQSCKGSCMFLQGKYFDKSCDNSYSDHMPFFAAAIEIATGCIPIHIKAEDDSLSPERQTLWINPKYIDDLPKIRAEPRKKNDL